MSVAPEQLDPVDAEDREIGVAVAVEVERVGARHPCPIRDGGGDRREPQRSAGDGGIAVEAGRVRPAGDVQVRPAVLVAVEHREPAAGRVDLVPVVCRGDPGAAGLVDEPRHRRTGRGTQRADGHERDADHGQDRRADDQAGGGRPARAGQAGTSESRATRSSASRVAICPRVKSSVTRGVVPSRIAPWRSSTSRR